MPSTTCSYQQDQKQRQRSEIIALVSSVVFFLVPLGLIMPVAYRWSVFGIALVFSLYLALTTIPLLAEWPLQKRLLCGGVFFCAFWFVFYSMIVAQWKAENAAKIEGDLHPLTKSKTAPEKLLVLGSAPPLDWEVPASQGFLYDAGLRIDVEDNELKLTTPVRDRFGHLVAMIEKNHWSVTSACLDKNYTQDSLEILDSRGHVVFQATILPTEIRLQGEWRDEFGNGTRIIAEQPYTGTVANWHTPAEEQELMKLIDPMFVYPSANHWREKRK